MVIPVNVARLLKAGGMEFGVLGEEEACCGNEIRRIGESGLFEELQEENLGSFTEYGVQEIIALSPHCMNALKKEYGIQNFDPMMAAFNHRHMNHAVFLMKCAYYAGMLAGGTKKHE